MRWSEEHLAAIEWTRIAEPGDPVARAIISEFGFQGGLDEVRAWTANRERTGREDGLGDLKVTGRHSAMVELDKAMNRWALRLEQLVPFHADSLAKRDLSIIIPGDAYWPADKLEALEHPPFALWVKGDPDLLKALSFAIVGSRTCTAYGHKVARDLAFELAPDYAIVSGGAFGIDVAAHSGALLAHGKTLIVSAGGADRAYPQAHEQLFDDVIADGGAIVSESPLGAAPQRHRFLSRNRLIAALAMATVVVEAPHRSGALSTARHALAMGRNVGGIPGPIDSPASEGVHELLRNGGTLVRNSGDVKALAEWEQVTIDDLDEKDFFTPVIDDRDPVEERVWEAVPLRRPASTSSIAAVAGLTVVEAQAKLGKLALEGRIVRGDRGWRRLAR